MDNIWKAAGLALIVGLAGCSDRGASDGAKSGDGDGAVAESGIKHRSAKSLPEVDEYLPPLGTAGIEIAPPAGWKLLPRGSTFLAGFCKEKANELPRITVADQPATVPGIDEVTAANAESFCQKMTANIKREGKSVQEPPRPIMLGDTIYARHVRLAMHNDTPAVIQSLQTVTGGQLYSVDLFCTVDSPRAEEYDASLTKWRDYAYAVAANIRFGSATSSESAGEEPASDTPAAETPPAETPADEPPAEAPAESTPAADSPVKETP
jgi:hypothetical protein